MPETSHTPGPWEWNVGRHTGNIRRKEPRTLCSKTKKSPVDGTDAHILIPVCKLFGIPRTAVTDINLEIHAADADEKLIAAAPELLEALQELVYLMESILDGSYVPDSFTTQPARAAIAKATEQ